MKIIFGRICALGLFCILFSYNIGQIVAQNISVNESNIINEFNEDTATVIFLNTQSKKLKRTYPDSALILAQIAEKIADKIQFNKGLIESYNNIGNIYKNKSNYELSLSYHQKSYNLALKVNNKKAQGRSLNNIGIIHYIQKDYKLAMEYYQKSVKIKTEIGDTMGLSFCYNNIATIHDIWNNYSTALKYIQKALEIKKEFNDSLGISICYQYLGRVNFHNSNYNSAENYYFESLALKNKLKDTYGSSQVFYNLASLYSHKAQKAQTNNKKNKYYDKVILYASESLKLSKEINALNNQLYAYRFLFEAHFEKEKLKKAVQYQTMYFEMKDSIYNLEKMKEIRNLEAIYQDQNKKILIESLSKENELKTKNLKTLNNRFILLIILLMLFITFIIMLLVYRKKIKRKSKKIYKQNETITSQYEEISQQNDSLNKYQNHLEEMIKDQTDDLVQAKENAEQADRLKTSFLENLSHEIRTPLNAIVGFSTLLKSDDLNKKKTNEYINYIMSGSDSLLNIVDSIMQVSKIQIGDYQLTYSEFVVTDILKSLIKEFSNSDVFLDKKDLELKLTVDESIKDIIIYSDEDCLKTILYNLIDNAVKYTESGFVELGVSINNNDAFLEFYIKDTGIGIKTENINYIFDKFRKGDSDKLKLYRGLGLGLTIAKSMVEKLNGNIWLETEINKGSCFYFTIPIIEPADKSDKIDITDKSETIVLDLSNRKILIAEDEQINLQLLDSILNRTNAKVFNSENGQEAIDLFKENTDIDLIFLDIKMPVMNGMDACKAIRKLKEGNKVKIIALTGLSIDYQEGVFTKLDFDDFVEKPIDIKNLHEILQKHIG